MFAEYADFDLIAMPEKEKTILQPITRAAYDFLEKMFVPSIRIFGAIEVVPATIMPVLDAIKKEGLVIR